MTKSELAVAIAEETGLTREDSAAALQAALRLIQAALVNGEQVELIGFGTFEVQARPARGARAPWTGRVPVFRPGASFRKAIHP